MSRIILLIIATVFLLTGIYVFFSPQSFYDATPGMSLMGPFNIHFIRDVAIAFGASGGAMAWGAWNQRRAVVIAGASWPILHALFHIQIWAMRGFPFDYIFFFVLFAIVTPALIALAAIWQLEEAPINSD